MEEFPERSFDVGISEQHAVTLAAGMATQGFIPFCTIYSTFLQRAYDQIIHDVALQKLPVVFCIDRAGLVGEDGATHHGVFDIAYLRLIPNLIIAAPMNGKEFQNILYTASLGLDLPIAIRYPRGRIQSSVRSLQSSVDSLKSLDKDQIVINYDIKTFKKQEIGKGKQISNGVDIAILTIGTVGNTIIQICKEEKYNKRIAHFNMRFIKPLDFTLLHQICSKYTKIITVEDGVLIGGFGSSILAFIQENNYKNIQLKRLGIPDNFIAHGTFNELKQLIGLDINSIKKEINKL